MAFYKNNYLLNLTKTQNKNDNLSSSLFELNLYNFSNFLRFVLIDKFDMIFKFVGKKFGNFHLPARTAPPSTRNKIPVMNEAESLIKNSIAADVSVTSPTLPIG